MRCFLSYSYKTDISVIKKILSEHDIFSVNPTESLEYGDSFLEVIRRQIKDSDFIVAVLDESTNVSFEIGLAIGFKKPVFIIIPEQNEKDIPFFLSMSTYTVAEATDYEKIKFSFDLFLKKLPASQRLSNQIIQKEKKQKHKITYDFVDSLSDIKSLKGKDFEDFVGNLFSSSHKSSK